MNVFFLSDLHIFNPQDPAYTHVIQFLQTHVKKNDILVLAGDIFDLFIGNKSQFKKEYVEWMQCIQTLSTNGIQIHYIEGNHDFYLKNTFKNIHGMTIHSHHLDLKVENKRFYIAHGDTIDRQDFSYLLLRAFLRNPIIKFMIYCTPHSWITSLGKWGSDTSRYRNRNPKNLSSYNAVHAVKRILYRNFSIKKFIQGYDFVILGHTHDLDTLCFDMQNRTGEYFNIGYPKIHQSFLRWNRLEKKMYREKFI